MSNPILVETIGRRIVIRFNRPNLRNPLSIEVIEMLSELMTRMSDAETVVFTGVDDVFASGADLREIAAIRADDVREFALRGQRLMDQISRAAAKTIAAVNGICFGGALDLALACDRRIAAQTALFSHPGANLGIITGWGGTQRLPRLVGQARALEMLYTAERITAEEALRIGLVDEIADDPVRRAFEI